MAARARGMGGWERRGEMRRIRRPGLDYGRRRPGRPWKTETLQSGGIFQFNSVNIINSLIFLIKKACSLVLGS